MKIREVTQYLESIAPLSLQESYDNAGLITGNPNVEVKGILTTLDATEAIVEEAIEQNCNLVIAHHPIVFFGLKKLNGKNYVERTVIKAIKNDIAIYAIHTNLDNVKQGVNDRICDKIELKNRRILAPKKDILSKLVTFVPLPNAKEVLAAISKAGAGVIGNYDQCSFQLNGKGTFRGNENTHPHIGTPTQLAEVEEVRLETILPNHLQGKVVNALIKTHPYEEVAYDLYPLANEHPQVGAGMVGELEQPMHAVKFLTYLKKQMQLNVIRHTDLLGKTIKRVAVCGGAGSFLLRKAMSAGADIFVTADYKYHEFFDSDGKIIIADIGHFESEIFTKDLLLEMLQKQFSNSTSMIKVSQVNTNPIQYF